MNKFQRAIADLFKIPTAKTIKRAYAAGGNQGAGLSGWLTPQSSADADLWHSIRPLIARSRALYRDDSNVQAVMGELVATVVDDGLKLQSKVTRRRGSGLDLTVNQRIEEAFNYWASNPEWCDVSGKHDFWQMQAIVQHNRLVDGGILIRVVNRRFAGSPIPFALELIDVDLLDDRLSTITVGRNDIRMGVEVNDWHRAIAYWLFDKHPGDIWQSSGRSFQSYRVAADEIIHVFNRTGWRPGQTRGVPALHAAILKARNLLGFEESELIKARIQACMSVFIETEYSDMEPLGEDEAGYPVKELFPGAVEYLDPGQKIASFDPSSPNPNAPAFIKHFQRAIARVLGMSSYAVTGDLSDANYSSLREGKLSEWRRVKIMRDHLNCDFNTPVFRRWMDAAVMSGFLKLPPDYEVNKARYIRDEWFGSPMPWVDPTKDIGAIEKEIQLGLTTQKRELAKRGIDFDDWCAEKKQEKETLERYGLEAPMAKDAPPEEPKEEDAPLVEGMQAVNPQAEPEEAEALQETARALVDIVPTITPEVLPPESDEPCCGDCADKEDDDDDDKNITINISINGNQLTASQESEESEDEEDEITETAIGDYTLLPGFLPVREMFGERKIKAKKKKKCTNGQVCGFSCISKAKTCIANMTTAEFKAHNAAKRAERREKAKAKKAAAVGGGIMPSSEVKTYQEAIERGKAIADPIIKDIESDLKAIVDADNELKGLYKSLDKLKKRSKKVYALPYEKQKEAMDKIGEEWNQTVDKINQVKTNAVFPANRIDAAMGKILDGQKKIKYAEALSLTKQTQFDEKALKKTRTLNKQKYKHDIELLSMDMTQFHRLTNGRAKIEEVTFTKDRAHAVSPTLSGSPKSAINIGTPARSRTGLTKVMFHEMAHHLEDSSPTITKIVTDWRNAKATGEPIQLKKIDPKNKSKYEDYEIAYPDKFASPYVGRTYELSGSKATEVLSVGMEHFSTPSRMGLLYNKDKEHFYLTLGILDSL